MLLVCLVCSMLMAQNLVVHYRNADQWPTVKMHWGYRNYENVADVNSSGTDAFGPYFTISWTGSAAYLTLCFNNGGNGWDGVDRKIEKPSSFPCEVWIKTRDGKIYFENPEDITPPIVSLTSPADGALLKGEATLSATATDNREVAKVEFYANAKKLGEDTTDPYTLVWNTAHTANQKYTLTAKAYDKTGNVGTSQNIGVTTQNPNVAPVAKMGGKIYGIVGLPVHFDGSGSYDLNGTIVNYAWTDGLGGTMTGIRPQQTYAQEGEYSIQLTVTDNEGAKDVDSGILSISKPLARGDFREETIYFLLPTRFFDGDRSNNYRSPDPNNKNPESDPEWRGDFKGLIEKLDYIKALGFTAVWVTPVVENKSGYDYHGYHAYDFNKTDARLLSSGYDLQRLINEVHSRGMKLVMDIVLNHSGNWGAKGLFEPVNNPNLPPQQQYMDRVRQLFSSGFYHDGWLSSWESYDEQNKSIAGDCMDFNTEDARTRAYLIASYNRMIDMGVDAFRVDTVKHVSRYIFNRYFVPAFQARGGKNFYMFGEVCTRVRSVWNRDIPSLSAPFYTWKERKDYSHLTDTEAVYQNWLDNRSNPENQPQSGNHYLNGNNYHNPDYSQRSGFDVIDFPMHWNFENAHTAFGIHGSDGCYNDATWNVVYVDSHDYGPDNNGKRYNGGMGAWAENFSLMFTFRGIPCIYYGSEVEFMAGAPCDEGMNAPLSATGRAYFGDFIEGSVQVENFGVWHNASGIMADTLSRPLSAHLARLNRIRRAIPALQKGQYSTQDISGGLAFKRRYTAGNVDSFVLVTISGGATFSNIPNGRYVDAVTGDVQNVTNGSLSAHCSGQGNMRVYVLDLPNNSAPGKIGDAGVFLK